MLWYNYTGGADVHHHYSMDDGFFADCGEKKALKPGETFQAEIPVRFPEDGIYTLQFECHFLLKIRFNDTDYKAYNPMSRAGLLPSVSIPMKRGRGLLKVTLRNPLPEGGEILPARFHLRFIDGDGEIVRQEIVHHFRRENEKAGKRIRGIPSLKGYSPGAGAAFKSAGRFCHTKGDGLLDCAVSQFGLITKAYIFGDPRYRKNLLWHYSVLPDGYRETGDVTRSFHPGKNETVTADWNGVSWEQRRGQSFFRMSYSLLSPSILIETNEKTLSLSRLSSACACRRMLLPLKRGIVERPDHCGIFYDREKDGPLAENWLLFFDNREFPEIPIEWILRTSPEKITVRRRADGKAERILIEFDSPARWAATLTPFGFESLTPDRIAEETWMERAVTLCRRHSRMALARPGSCREYFRRTGDSMEIVQRFRHRILKDAFNTPPLPCAPLPPVAALAALHGQGVVLDRDAEDICFPTKYGPFHAVKHSTYSVYTVPIPEYRREFVLSERAGNALSEDFGAYLKYHQELPFIPNPGVHQFLFPFAVPLLTFNELTEDEREQLLAILRRNLKKACRWNSSYTGPQNKRCFMWYERKDPCSGVSYAINYLHVSGILDLPDCRRDTILHAERPFIEVDWGNGIALYSIWLAALFTGDWDVIRRNLDTLQKAFDYYLVTMDWACMCAPYCENGRGWSDGTNYGGYLGYVNMMEILGEKERFETALYAYGKMCAERIGLFYASQKYLCGYFAAEPWYSAKTFPDEAGPCLAAASCPTDILHGHYREQSIYNMTTEGHYPETFAMYARYCPDGLRELLEAAEESQSDGKITGPLKGSAESEYSTHGEQFGEQEVYSYLMLSLMSRRFGRKKLLAMTAEAAENKRLSREFLGAHAFSCRRIPKHWTEVYLKDQIRHAGKPKALRWFAVKFGKTALPELEVTPLAEDAFLELLLPHPAEIRLGKKKAVYTQNGNIYKIAITEKGILSVRER